MPITSACPARTRSRIRCDAQTISADDRARGVATFIAGFAPPKPAQLLLLEIRLPTGG